VRHTSSLPFVQTLTDERVDVSLYRLLEFDFNVFFSSSNVHGKNLVQISSHAVWFETTNFRLLAHFSHSFLLGFEWRSLGSRTGGGGGSKAEGMDLEKSVMGEAKALEDTSIYVIIESDDRVGIVVRHIDETLAELERLEQMMGLHKSRLLEDYWRRHCVLMLLVKEVDFSRYQKICAVSWFELCSESNLKSVRIGLLHHGLGTPSERG
jgi:hypothetical protein